jgi:endonuclease/exonuclease/phosphatase family metal-dependent hydrolase
VRVLGGDFNADAASPEVSWLAEHAALDVRSVFAPGASAGATHPLPPQPGRPGRRIDFLFTVAPRGEAAPRVRRTAIALNAPIDGVWPSDHAAVVAEIGSGGL